MKAGFTGTRHGMTDAQRKAFRTWADGYEGDIMEFHHGSCMGADVEAARIIASSAARCRIIAHPGPDGDGCQRSSGVDHERREPRTHFARNRNIVDECWCLVACPFDMQPQQRGGTWYTIEYAKKTGKPIVMLWPNGLYEYIAKGNEDEPI